MHTSNNQRLVGLVLGNTFFGLCLIAFGGLIWQAFAISQLAPPAIKFVSFGPIEMIRLSKLPIDGGFVAHFEFLPGLTWFFIIGVSLSLLLSILIIAVKQRVRTIS